MKCLRIIAVLQFAVHLAVGQTANKRDIAAGPDQAKTLIRRLYKEVLARHPVGVPEGADLRALAPYLSKPFLHQIDLSRACHNDSYNQEHANPHMKAEFPSEYGLFSGDDEQTEPRSFEIERIEPEKDGSFHVYVRLEWGPSDHAWIWQVAPIVTPEKGRYVVNDVIFLKDENRQAESRASEYLLEGCNGPHWVGIKQ